MSGGFTYQIIPPDPAEWQRLGKGAEEGARRSAELVGNTALKAVRAATPVGETVNLQGRWRLEKRDDMTYQLVNSAEYAAAVSEGSAPHVITPVNASVLVFEVAGTTVYARRVNHPGTEPNPYVEDAVEQASGRFESGIQSILAKSLGF